MHGQIREVTESSELIMDQKETMAAILQEEINHARVRQNEHIQLKRNNYCHIEITLERDNQTKINSLLERHENLVKSVNDASQQRDLNKAAQIQSHCQNCESLRMDLDKKLELEVEETLDLEKGNKLLQEELDKVVKQVEEEIKVEAQTTTSHYQSILDSEKEMKINYQSIIGRMKMKSDAQRVLIDDKKQEIKKRLEIEENLQNENKELHSEIAKFEEELEHNKNLLLEKKAYLKSFETKTNEIGTCKVVLEFKIGEIAKEISEQKKLIDKLSCNLDDLAKESTDLDDSETLLQKIQINTSAEIQKLQNKISIDRERINAKNNAINHIVSSIHECAQLIQRPSELRSRAAELRARANEFESDENLFSSINSPDAEVNNEKDDVELEQLRGELKEITRRNNRAKLKDNEKMNDLMKVNMDLMQEIDQVRAK